MSAGPPPPPISAPAFVPASAPPPPAAGAPPPPVVGAPPPPPQHMYPQQQLMPGTMPHPMSAAPGFHPNPAPVGAAQAMPMTAPPMSMDPRLHGAGASPYVPPPAGPLPGTAKHGADMPKQPAENSRRKPRTATAGEIQASTMATVPEVDLDAALTGISPVQFNGVVLQDLLLPDKLAFCQQ